MAKQMICAVCGSKAKPKTKTKGSFVIEIILWFCFIIPGVLYSIWRSTSLAKVKICGNCKSPNIIPIDTPNGKILNDKFYGVSIKN